MWNIMASSKLTQQRSQQKNLKLHKDKLKQMKPMIKIASPQQPIFMFTKMKQEMNKRQRLIEIDRQNSILLSKMQNLKDTKPAEDKLRPESQWLKTLNIHFNNTIKERVNIENQRICSKLLQINTHYPRQNLVKSSRKMAQLSRNISQNARRVKSSKSLYRPTSASYISSSRFHRNTVDSKQNRYNNQHQLQLSSNSKLRPTSAPTTHHSGFVRKDKDPHVVKYV